MADKTDRRCFLARGIVGAAGIGAACGGVEETTLRTALGEGADRAATAAKPKTDIPPGSLPCGKIRNVSLSRLFLGGNLIGGWAHSRDLMYVSKLFTVLQHRGQGLRDPGSGAGVRHQHDPDRPRLLGRGLEVQPAAAPPRSKPWSASA